MTGEPRHFLLQPWTLALGLVAGVALPAQAQSLVTLYESARSFDASYQSAKSQFDATWPNPPKPEPPSCPAPTSLLAASRTNQEVLPTPDRSYGTQTATISASQPLYRPANWASYEQGNQQTGLGPGPAAGGRAGFDRAGEPGLL